MTEQKKPWAVYAITEATKEGGKDFWTRVGTGFWAKSGAETMIINLNALPTNAKLVAMPQKEQTDGKYKPAVRQPGDDDDIAF